MLSLDEVTWKNWAGTVMSKPESFELPQTLQDVKKLVDHCRAAGKKMRVVGAGHSFTPLVATSEVLVSMEHLTGLDSIDHDQNRVTFWAGTSLKDVGNLLDKQGYAMENLGDINVQSIAGAIGTGTHGTGITYGSISTQVASITLITSTGELLTISREEHETYFDAVRLSLGMLGVIVKVQLQVIPRHRLTSETYKIAFPEILKQLHPLRQQNQHFEFFWFPYTNKVQAKRINRAESETASTKKQGNNFNQLVVENGLLWVLSQLCRMQPKWSKAASELSALGIPSATETGDSHHLYATPRLVRFYEMEYSVPADRMGLVLTDIQHVLEKHRFHVHFPIECRYVKEDNIWLSPSYHRDSAYIAVHMFKGMEFQPYFSAMEEIFQHYNGRPHWGKMHTLTTEKLERVYPKFHEFLRIREELDPQQMFTNAYLRRLFSIK